MVLNSIFEAANYNVFQHYAAHSLASCEPFMYTCATLRVALTEAIYCFYVLQKLEKQRARGYEELKQRIDREQKMQKVAQELNLQKQLMVSVFQIYKARPTTVRIDIAGLAIDPKREEFREIQCTFFGRISPTE